MTAPAVRPAVSVVVPTLGRAALLEGLLRSLRPVLEAYAEPTEVVLCDASTGTDATAVAAAAERHGARLVRSPRGVARQRNAGVAASSAPLLWFVDSDCLAEVGALQALADRLAADAGAAGAAGRLELHGPRSAWLDAAVATGVVASFDGFGARPGDRLPWAVTANLLLRRDRLDEVGGFGPSLPAGEDVDLGLRLDQALVWAPEALVLHRTETWDRGPDALRRFLAYGAADAHLLRRHPGLRGPLEPSVVNAAPLAVAVAVLGSRSGRQAAARAAVWAVLALALLAVQGRSRRTALAGLLVECLHAGRQAEAVRRRAWSSALCGVVLDPGQRARERVRRRRTAAALALAAVPTLLRRTR